MPKFSLKIIVAVKNEALFSGQYLENALPILLRNSIGQFPGFFIILLLSSTFVATVIGCLDSIQTEFKKRMTLLCEDLQYKVNADGISIYIANATSNELNLFLVIFN